MAEQNFTPIGLHARAVLKRIAEAQRLRQEDARQREAAERSREGVLDAPKLRVVSARKEERE